MAQSKKQLANLKRGNPETQFKPGREQVEISQKGNEAKRKKRKRRQSLEEATQMAARKVRLNDIGVSKLKRKGLDIDGIDPEDMTGIAALAVGQLAAGINGNSQAAQNFADWLDLSAKHKKEQLEREKLESEIEKLKAEIDRLRNGSGGGSQDNEFLNAWKQSIIDGYKDNKDGEE